MWQLNPSTDLVERAYLDTVSALKGFSKPWLGQASHGDSSMEQSLQGT